MAAPSDNPASGGDAPAASPVGQAQGENPQLYGLLRYVCFLLAAVSFGAFACYEAARRVICTLPPDRFEGGQGFALNAPLMIAGLWWLLSFWGAFAMLILIHVGRWRSLARIPNPLTILLLLPGMWVMLKILWLLVSRFVWNFGELFRDV